MKILKQIVILVAASAFKLRVKDWTILQSWWTPVLQDTGIEEQNLFVDLCYRTGR